MTEVSIATSEFIVRRARRTDLPAVAELHNRCRPAAPAIGPQDVLLSLAERGYLLAWRGAQLAGVLAWSAENLVARVLDAYLDAGAGPDVIGRLLSAAEDEACVLYCEAMLLPASEALARVAEIAGAAGYTTEAPDTLPAAWREAAGELCVGVDRLLVKRLSARRVSRPI